MNRVSRSETVEDSPALQRWVSVYKKQAPSGGGIYATGLSRLWSTKQMLGRWPEGRLYPISFDVSLRTDSHRDRNHRLRPRYWPIQRVALKRHSPGLGDQANQFLAAQSLRRGRTGVVVDLLFHDGSVDVVSAEAQGDLRHLRGHHLPVRLDVREVVEHQARHGNLPQIEHAGGLG